METSRPAPKLPATAPARGTLLWQKARVISGSYGDWEVLPAHDGEEIWVIARPPRQLFYRDRQGRIDRGPVYRREDGAVARAEYLELLPEFKMTRTEQ